MHSEHVVLSHYTSTAHNPADVLALAIPAIAAVVLTSFLDRYREQVVQWFLEPTFRAGEGATPVEISKANSCVPSGNS